MAYKPPIHGRDHCPGGADPIPCLHNHPQAFLYGLAKDDFSDGPVIDEVGDPYFPVYTELLTNEGALGQADGSWYVLEDDGEPFPGYAGLTAVGIIIMKPGLYLTELWFHIVSDEVDYAYDFGWDHLSTSFVGFSYTNLSQHNEQGYHSAAEAAARLALGLPETGASDDDAQRSIYHTRMLNLETGPLTFYPSGWVAPVPGGAFVVECQMRVVYLCPPVFIPG